MNSLTALDSVQLNFNAATLTALNVVLAVIMFGVALDLTTRDFRRVVTMPRAFAVGLVAQFVLLPAMTYLLVLALRPPPSVALGLFLVAACPGGTISNFLTAHARGNTALSVSMSAVSSLAAIVMTPLNLSFWSSLYAPTAVLLTDIALNSWRVVAVVLLVLALPLVLGLATRTYLPRFAERLFRPFRLASIACFVGFVALALQANWSIFVAHVADIAILVIAHNLIAFASGYGVATMAGLTAYDRRAVTLELGIQNSGLGLVLVFDFFDGLGGMASFAALWGIWHIVAGLGVAEWWRGRALPTTAA
ncbi:MAG: bile acid:sodium symporter family protein [Pseudomonadota bacterium]